MANDMALAEISFKYSINKKPRHRKNDGVFLNDDGPNFQRRRSFPVEATGMAPLVISYELG
jgi:hypothetical protein